VTTSEVTEKTFWQHFDEQAKKPLTAAGPDPVGTAIAQQIKDMGCAVYPSDSFDPESAAYAKLRTEWIKLCRGDTKMEDKFSKVVAIAEIAMQPLLDELEAQTRRLEAAKKVMIARGLWGA
jgi:hypothetical protein